MRLQNKPARNGGSATANHTLQRYSLNFSESSSIKDLTTSGDLQELEIDRSGVKEYLIFGYIHAPNTIFRDVKRLDHVSEPDPIQENLELQLADAKKSAVMLLKQTLKSRLSDRTRPAALMLSSGLDSCAIACAVDEPLLTYTLGFTFRDWNEFEIAEEVARTAGHQHTNIMLSDQDLYDNFDPWIHSLNQPYAHINALPTWMAMREIRKHTDLVLDGSGADDAMGDVGRIKNRYGGHAAKHGRRIIDGITRRIPTSVLARIYDLTPDSQAARFIRLATPLRERKIYYSFWKGFLYRYLTGENYSLPVDVDRMVNNLSWRVDYNYFLYHRAWAYEAAMGRMQVASASTDLPYYMPFADPEYTALLLTFPATALFDKGQPKHMLVDLIKSVLPAYRYKKAAIDTPWATTLKSPLWRHDLENLPDQLSAANPDRIHKISRQFLSGKADHSERLLCLLVLARWLEHNDLELPDGII